MEANPAGLTLAGSGFVLSRDTVRAPDVSFIREERARDLNLDCWIEGAPDLAVEIISVWETAADIAHKIWQYMRAGGKVVWVVYPRDHCVHIFESSGAARVLGADDLLEAPTLLPGFSVRVSEILA